MQLGLNPVLVSKPSCWNRF